MREWQVGDHIGDGNDIGVPDVKYMDYLKNKDDGAPIRNNDVKPSDIEKSKMYQEEAWKLHGENKFYDALTFINAAINHNPNDEENWNIKGMILSEIFLNNDKNVAFEAYDCYNKALALNPYDKTIKNNKAIFLTQWAIELFASSEAEATKRINEALSIFENKNSHSYAAALYVKAYAIYRNEEYDEALKYINKGVELLPDDNGMVELKQEILYKLNNY